jgi:hypothetical protein
MNRTFPGATPWAASSMLISSVPMLLVPLTPIFLPASSATLVICCDVFPRSFAEQMVNRPDDGAPT